MRELRTALDAERNGTATLPTLDTYLDGDLLLADCPGCGQAGRVTRGANGLLHFDCYAMCGAGSGAYREPVAEASTLTSFSEIAARPVKWAWRDRIALSKITALAGRPKIGKGLLYSHLIASVTAAPLRATSTGHATRSSSQPRTTRATR